jgi:RNA-directed DNA polymerase
MKLEEKHIAEIKAAFERMQSKEDLLHLLNEVKPLIYGEKTLPFKLKQLTWHANPKLGGKRYTSFKVRKKSGTERTIHAPVNGLKAIQKTLALILQCVFEPHEAATGFVRKKSIVDNAKLHVGRRFVYNIDLKDFFSSIDQARVWKMLQLKPFNLNPTHFKDPHGMRWEDFKEKYIGKDVDVTFWVGKGRPFTTVDVNGNWVQIFVSKNFDKDKDKFIVVAGDSIRTKGNDLDSRLINLINKPNNFLWEDENDADSDEAEKLKNKSPLKKMLEVLTRISKYDRMPFKDWPDGYYTLQENDYELDDEVQDFIQIKAVTYTFKKSDGNYEVSGLGNSFSPENLVIFNEFNDKSLNDFSSHEKQFTILKYSANGFDVEDEKVIEATNEDIQANNNEDLVKNQISILPDANLELDKDQSKKKTNKGKSIGGSLWLVNKVPDANRLQIANMIANISCTEMEVERKNDAGEWEVEKRNVLPQGAPTSPVITNIVCQRLDYLLTGLAKRFGLIYSRYADDITFSSMHNVYQPESEFLKELHRIISEQKFHIKESKTRLQQDGYRKEVTGLLVNEKANVQQRYIKQLRMWLYYWERYGYERASEFFLQHYIADKGHVMKGKPDMANVISGKLDYLKMVKGADNELYQKLKERFEKITGKVASVSKNLIEVEEVETGNTPLMKLLLGLTEQPIVFSEEKIMDVPTKVKTDEKPIPVFHKPKELVALLKNFSVNDSALKYTTHSWDAGRDANIFKDLSEFLSIAKSRYSEFSYDLKGLSENLNGKIYNFLFNKEIAKSGWGDINPKKRIYFGWSSPELLEACNNDISLNPEDFILPEKYQVQRAGKTLQKFKHIIDVFKNEIEVRDENSALLNLILQKHDHYLISFSAPKVSNLENKTFYTDIQWLGKALDLIFEGIQKYPQHPVVEYAVTESNNDRLVLTILHRNSFKNGLSIHDDKLNLKRGDFSTIKDKLRNLCDWCIESEFSEGAYRINYLISDNEISAYEKIMSAEGFKHILTFYK